MEDKPIRGRAGGQRLTNEQRELLALKKQEASLNEEMNDSLKDMEKHGLNLNKYQQKRLRGAKTLTILSEEHSGLEKKLTQQAQSLNKVKSKQASLAAAQLKSLKKSHDDGKITEDQFKTQVDLVSQLSGNIGDMEEVQSAINSLGDDATDTMKEYLNVQLHLAKTQATQKTLLESADDLTGGMASKAKDFAKQLATNPLAAVIVAATAALKIFSEQLDGIGERFGAMGVQQFRGELTLLNAELISMGYESGAMDDTIESMSNNFGIGFRESVGMAAGIADMSKALAISVDEGGQFVGMMTDTFNLTSKQAIDMAKMTEQLARANDVAPGAVLKDIAKSSETFAKFSNQSEQPFKLKN